MGFNAKTVLVKSGDTLWSIAKQHLGDGARWSEIYQRNKDAITARQPTRRLRHLTGPDLIYPGTPLVIECAQQGGQS